MKIYLQNIVKELRQYSESLDKQSILVNKPWALIDSDLGIQKLIFKKNNELILSKDGQVTEGKWEYFAEAKCLLIDRGTDKILCNETYIDDSILVLKVDGKSDSFFVLANENTIPDLDAYSYLSKLYERKYNLQITALTDDSVIQIQMNENYNLGVGSKVMIDLNLASDGEYVTKDQKKKYRVKNSKIDKIIYRNTYETDQGFSLIVEQQNKYGAEVGDRVVVDNQVVKKDVFFLPNESQRLIVEDYEISKIYFVITYTLENNEKIVVEQNYLDGYHKGDKVFVDNNPPPDGKYKIRDERIIKVRDGVVVKVGMDSSIKSLIIVLLLFIVLVLFLFIIVESQTQGE